MRHSWWLAVQVAQSAVKSRFGLCIYWDWYFIKIGVVMTEQWNVAPNSKIIVFVVPFRSRISQAFRLLLFKFVKVEMVNECYKDTIHNLFCTIFCCYLFRNENFLLRKEEEEEEEIGASRIIQMTVEFWVYSSTCTFWYNLFCSRDTKIN